MEGFLDGVPLLVKVTWAGAEVPMLSGKPLPHGLLAETATNGVPGGVTRWLVPWEVISYIKQDIPVPPVSEPPQVIPGRPENVGPPPDKPPSERPSRGR